MATEKTPDKVADSKPAAPVSGIQYHTNPARLIIVGMLVILLFFGGLGGISATMHFSGAVIVPGTVKVSGERQTIQHLEGGIVEEILVVNGDQVKVGDLLLKLKSSRADASYQIVRGMLFTQLAEAGRLRAQKNMSQKITWSQELLTARADEQPEVAEVMAKEEEILISSLTVIETRRQMFQSRILQLKEQIVGAEEELVARRRIVASLESEIELKKPLLEQHYIDQSQLQALERQLDEHRSMMAGKRQVMAQAHEKISEIKINLIDLENGFREEAIAQLSRVTQSIFELREKLIPTLDAYNRLEITAPVAGTVVNLMVHSETGGVVRPGEMILEIVPDDAHLVIEGSLRQDKITKVKKGQKTRVTLNAFNRVTTPPIAAVVTYISADSITTQTPHGPISSYIIQVEPDVEALLANNVYLLPGMPAVCYVETEKRTFLQYLIEPLTLNMDRALRETL